VGRITLKTLGDLDEGYAGDAVESSTALRGFLAHAAAIAKPDDDGPNILKVLGKLTGAYGDVRVEISGDAVSSTITIYADQGGFRERVVPAVRLGIPFDEFVTALMLTPRLAAPLKAREQGGTIVLTSSEGRADSVEFSPIAIAESSLHENERKTGPPTAAARAAHDSFRQAEPSPPDNVPSPTTTEPPDRSGVHTHPTVRRMVAIGPEAIASAEGRTRERRDDDDEPLSKPV
jgi:hypothetical protein